MFHPGGRLTVETAAPRGTSEVDEKVSSNSSRCFGLESLDPREDGWEPKGRGRREEESLLATSAEW